MTENEKKVWRPGTITIDVVSKLETCFKRDFSVKEACSYVGISVKAYYRKYNKSKEFRDKMDSAKQVPLWVAKNKLFEHINSSDPNISYKATIEFLKHRSEERKEKPQDITINNTPRFSCIEIIDATWETASTTDKKTEGTSEELQW